MVQLNFNVAQVERKLATKTLDAIHYALQADGGSKFRVLLRDSIALAEDTYREETDSFRSHLGASQIGSDCARDLWYRFRWAASRDGRDEFHTQIPHDRLAPNGGCDRCARIKTRMIRLLNRGHLEEARFIALLKMINCKVYTHDSAGKQFKISMHGGHFGGSLDSVVVGVPDLPDGEPALTEMKTHKDDSFSKLITSGLRESKPQHYDQMQQYMGGYALQYGLYLAVNKDNDDLYGEIVGFNPERYAMQVDRADLIIRATLPPPKINENPGWYKCKMCDAHALCHKAVGPNGAVTVPLRNCRTCKYSRVVEGGWACSFSPLGANRLKSLSKQEQIEGCHNYSVIKEM